MNIPFVEARWYTPTRSGRRIDYIVIHDMEAPEKGDTAENIARYFATTETRASAHYQVDSNSIVQSVREMDIAYHAPPNIHSIGVEHAGYARQTRDQWLDDYGRRMLRLSADLVADLLDKYDLPSQFLSPAELKAGKRGVTTHRNVSRAFGQTSHTDPGPDFPVGWYMDRVRARRAQTTKLSAAPAAEEDDMPYTDSQLINFARIAVQAELGDENQGAFSDRIVQKVIAAMPKPEPAAECAIDLDALAESVADKIAARMAE